MGYRLPLTPDQRAAIVRLYMEGKSSPALGKMFGRSHRGILNILLQEGVTTQSCGANRIPEPACRRMAVMYREGATAEEIAARIGCSSAAVRRWLRRAGVQSRYRIGADEINAILDRYRQGESAAALARRFKHGSNTSITRLIEKHGGSVRSPQEAAALTKRPINDFFFSQIDSKEKAYWLGFIATDGNVFRKYGKPAGVQIGLAASEHEHLRAFARALQTDAPVFMRGASKGRPNGGCQICIASVQIAKDLGSCGITPAKTFTVQPWEGPADLMASYWLGCFDGDGGWSRRPNGLYTLTFCGNRFMVDGFADFVAQKTGIKRPITQNGSVWHVGYYALTNLHVIVPQLWDDFKLYSLPRKTAIAKKVLDMVASSRHRSRLEAWRSMRNNSQ